MRSLPKLSPSLAAALEAKKRALQQEAAAIRNVLTEEATRAIHREDPDAEGGHAMSDVRHVAHERAVRVMRERAVPFAQALDQVRHEDAVLSEQLDELYRRPSDARGVLGSSKWDRRLHEDPDRAGDEDPRATLTAKAHEHARRHGVTFAEAVAAVMTSDRTLSEAVESYYR